MSKERKEYNHRVHTVHGGKGQKSKLSALIALIFGIVLLSLSGCPNEWMEEILKPLKDKENGITFFTVTFDSDGGSEVPSQPVAEGKKATRPDNPTKDDYGFMNWYDNEDLTDPHYDFDTPVTANITLYAKWKSIFDAEDFGPGPYTIKNTFDVSNITEWNAAKTAISTGGNDANYIINVIEGFTVPGATTVTFGDATGIKVSLRGDKTLTLSDANYLIRPGSNQTVILRDLTLKGRSSGTAPVVSISAGTFIMRSGEISGNTSTATQSGAGVTVSGGTFTMHGGKISGNKSPFGGVVLSQSTSIFTMHGGEISGNNATSQGGGVYMANNGATFTMHGGKISDNTATSGGGGVYLYAGTFRMHGGEISVNTANTDGGGMYVQTGTFIMDGGEISVNTANQNGGGVYVDNQGTFTMNSGKISGNTANGTTTYTGGGGVFMSGANAKFTMENGEISGNTANQHGGGVYGDDRSTLTMQGGTISGNTANQNGGGVYMYTGATYTTTFTMDGGTISGNKARSGGGVYMTGVKAAFTMLSGEISGNTTTYNYYGHGGGVYVNGGTFDMKGGEISGNTTSLLSNGGGVYVGSATFTMHGGEISGNKGGDMGGGVSVAYNGTFRIVTGTIYGLNEGNASLRNTAGGFGAALYNDTGTAQRGTFSGTTWTGTDLELNEYYGYDNTIRVEEGAIVP